MEPVSVFESIARSAAAANPVKAGDYTKDGLLYCGICHTPKQSKQAPFGKSVVYSCLCRCAITKRDEEDAARRKREEADKAMRLRETGIPSQEFRNATFASADGINSVPLDMVRKYAENWEHFYAKNTGLLLYGGVGTGKSFAAACLANYMIDRGVPSLMVNFSDVLNSVSDYRREDRIGIFSSLSEYPLVILDDFGMERQTEYALEQMFNFVDTRERSGKPLVVTTNLGLSELRSPKDMAHKRIYDRIMALCVPVFFGEQGRRAAISQQKLADAAAILRG